MNMLIRREPKPMRPPPLVDRELTLCEMLDDPIVITVMRRDGVTRAQILRLFDKSPLDCLCLAA